MNMTTIPVSMDSRCSPPELEQELIKRMKTVTTCELYVQKMLFFLFCRIGKILKFKQLSVTWPSCDRDTMATAEQIEEQFEALAEANDSLMERVVRCWTIFHGHTLIARVLCWMQQLVLNKSLLLLVSRHQWVRLLKWLVGIRSL